MRNVLILTLLVLSVRFAGAQQFENIVLDTNLVATKDSGEPGVAISLKDRDNIVAVKDGKAYVTFDGGKTWTTNSVPSPMGVPGSTEIISDTKGDLYYFHLSSASDSSLESEEMLDQIVCQKSDDGGYTWSEGEVIGYNHPKDQTLERATVDLDKNNIYITWTQFDSHGAKDSECQSDILISESKNRGKKWSDPIRLNELSGNCLDDDGTVMGSMPAVGPEGRLYAAWAHDGKIFLDRSFDKGKTWLRFDIEVASQPRGWTLNIPGLKKKTGQPVLISDNSDSQYQGALYLNWSDQRNGDDDTDVWFSRSLNYGDSWERAVRINDDGPGKHQFLSWMAIDNTSGYIYIVYYDRSVGDDAQTDVFLAYSTNGGSSFENIKISEESFSPDGGVSFGDYTHIAAHDGRIVPIWTRIDDGNISAVTTIIEQEELPGVNPQTAKNKRK